MAESSSKELPFSVLFLAAGFGTRLGERAKGLLPHKGSTILETLIENLSTSIGMMSFAFITNARFAAEYERVLEKYQTRFNIHFLNNQVKTAEEQKTHGALVDLSQALKSEVLRGRPTLVLSIDTVFEEPGFFQNFMKVITAHPNDFVTVMRRFDNPSEIRSRLGCALIDGDKIVDFFEKPITPPANHDKISDFWLGAVPFYYFPVEAIELLHSYVADPATKHDAPGNIIPFLLRRGFPVRASITQGFTLDVGTATDVTRLSSML